MKLARHCGQQVQITQPGLIELARTRQRPPRIGSSNAIDVACAETVEIAGNNVDRPWHAGINVHGAKISGNARDVPLSRILIYQNRVLDGIRTGDDCGNIETWQGGPAYVFNATTKQADLLGGVAAALASGSLVYRADDAEFAAKLLAAARQLWDWGTRSEGTYNKASRQSCTVDQSRCQERTRARIPKERPYPRGRRGVIQTEPDYLKTGSDYLGDEHIR